jgi:O-antigen/teichoic acid export membrane protein
MAGATSLEATAPATVPPPPQQQTLRKQVLRGSLQTLVFYGFTQALRLGSNLVLTRILFPEAFGTMALCWVVLEGIELFSDVGIRPAIVQSKLGHDRAFLNTAWTIQIARGLAIWLITLGLGPLLAWIYPEHPDTAYLMPIVGIASILAGFYSTKIYTAMKELRPSRALAVQLTGQVSMVAVMLFLAWQFQSIWAVAAGSLVNPLVQLIVSHTMLPGPRDRVSFDRDHARALFRYGRWVFVSTLFTFLARQADRLLFAKYMSGARFGVYNIALVGLAMCVEVVSHVVEWVAFPAYARKLAAGESVQQIYARITTFLQIGAGAAVAGLICGAPALIDTLYDDRYLEAGSMLRMLGFAAWFTVLEACCSSLAKALATNHWMAAGHATKFFGLLIAIPTGYHFGGLQGALIGVAIADVARYAVAATGLARHGYHVVRRDLQATLVLAIAVTIGLTVDANLDPSLPAPVRLLASVGAAVGPFVLRLLWALHVLRRQRA